MTLEQLLKGFAKGTIVTIYDGAETLCINADSYLLLKSEVLALTVKDGSVTFGADMTIEVTLNAG